LKPGYGNFHLKNHSQTKVEIFLKAFS